MSEQNPRGRLMYFLTLNAEDISAGEPEDVAIAQIKALTSERDQAIKQLAELIEEPFIRMHDHLRQCRFCFHCEPRHNKKCPLSSLPESVKAKVLVDTRQAMTDSRCEDHKQIERAYGGRRTCPYCKIGEIENILGLS